MSERTDSCARCGNIFANGRTEPLVNVECCDPCTENVGLEIENRAVVSILSTLLRAARPVLVEEPFTAPLPVDPINAQRVLYYRIETKAMKEILEMEAVKELMPSPPATGGEGA